MSNHLLELGAVYQPDWDERPMRVIAFDESVVMYDSWWPHEQSWGFAKRIPSTVTYYRLPRKFLLARARYLRTECYTEKEFETHRPDLPLAFAQFDAINWYDGPPANRSQLSRLLSKQAKRRDSGSNCERLSVTAVCLCPFGPKNSTKKGALVKARDGNGFTVAELLWEAWCLQVPNLRDERVTNGIGLYRLGLEHRIPSYYIWGATSRLEE
jgi:hypothetical protein